LQAKNKRMDAEYILSLDIGGTKILGVLISRSAEIVSRRLVSSPRGNEAVLGSVIELISSLLASAEALNIRPSGIAIDAPGFVDSHNGCVLAADNLRVENLCLTGPVENRFHLPARLFHDVRSAMLGEAVFGAGKGCHDFVFLNIGTGISVGLYLNGKVYNGATGKAGEIGHFAHRPVGPGNPCPLDERLEALVSGPALVCRAARLDQNHPSLTYPLAGRDPNEILTTQMIHAAALRRDTWAVELIEETADYLGAAVGGMLDLLDPECVILGGGIAAMGEVLLEPLRRSVARYAIKSVPLILARFGGDACAIGGTAYYFGQGG
jgi:glucokinase